MKPPGEIHSLTWLWFIKSYLFQVSIEEAMLNLFVYNIDNIIFGACLFCSLEQFPCRNLCFSRLPVLASMDPEYLH